jgi:two-component system chemotaxis sensor kinase CheA
LLGRRIEELQTGILEVRMVPLEQLFDKLSRVVRKLSREAGKPVEFFVSGGETELDKLIVEELSDPLMHIIRNCIDHGIEPEEERIQAQKSPEGMIALRAFQKGNHVVIEVEDDGVGIDTDKVMETAVERGIVDQQITSEMTDREVLNLIFAPGFTTRIEADAVSGRGVGMDVVKTNIARLSGLIDIKSSPAMGTKFILTLPVTLAIIQALVVKVGENLYAVPLASVLEALAIRRSDIRTVERREVITLRRSTLPLVRLREMFDLPPQSANGERQFVIVVGMAQHRIGLVVDELKGQQDVVIKSLGPSLSTIPGIAGATELGDQRIALVLDLAALVNEAVHGEGRIEPAKV